MANTTENTTTATHVDDAEKLLDELKARARQAHDAGDAFMLGLYNDLLRVCSPVVVRAIARAEREEKAAINKAHKALRKSQSEQKQKSA